MAGEPTDLKFGRLPARYTLRSVRFALAMTEITQKLGPPPVASNPYYMQVQHLPCDIYDNDKIGDCVAVDSAYGLIVRTANASEATVIPTVNDVVSLYSTVGGYVPGDHSTDNGTNESEMCSYLKKTGWLGHKLDGWGTTNPTDFDQLKWMIHLFGGCRIGVAFPNYSMKQFRDGSPFDLSHFGDQGIGGLHDVRLLHYHGDDFYCSTWGRWMQPVTRDWIAHYCEESHPELAYDWIAKQGLAPSGLNLADLEARLKEADTG